MSGLRDRCPSCSRRLIITRFDTTFRLSDRTERLCFGIPGGLCEDCHQLYIDPELIELLDLGRRPLRVRHRERRRAPGGGLVLGRLTAGSVLPLPRTTGGCPGAASTRRRAGDPVLHPEREGEPDLALRRP